MNKIFTERPSLAQGIFDFTSERFDDGILISNMFCDFLYLSKEDYFDFLQNGSGVKSASLRKKLIECRFIYESKKDFIEASISIYRKLKGFQFVGTVLHIFVLTLNCNLECSYCQATAGKHNRTKSMTTNIADSCVDRAFESMSKNIDIEFQGGEPLLNFQTLKFIIEKSCKLAVQKEKKVTFSLVTNLSCLTEEMAAYLASHNVGISVSLDGPRDLHDLNRPHAQKHRSNFDDIIRGLEILNKHYPTSDGRISALLTTTNKSFSRIDDIIDIYSTLKLGSFSVRPLSPFGLAKTGWDSLGYSPMEFGKYYYEFLERILAKNVKSNGNLVEFHARMFLNKIFNKTPINHMEFRSPCGAAIGQITYDWNGDVYTCDEARMLAAAGDKTFLLGNVIESSYDSIMNGKKVRSIAQASCLESLPDCVYCVYQPLCGVCPVYNYAKYGDLYRITANDYFCQTRKEIFNSFFQILFNGSLELKNKLLEWGVQ